MCIRDSSLVVRLVVVGLRGFRHGLGAIISGIAGYLCDSALDGIIQSRVIVNIIVGIGIGKLIERDLIGCLLYTSRCV